MNITKRNGKVVPFDINKIKKTLKKAFKACSYKIEDAVIEEIANSVIIWEDINVEDIQDQLEELLMDYDYLKVAKEFILYRERRRTIRDQESKLIKSISEKLKASNVENQNANVDECSFGGRIGEASRAVCKEYALNYCMSEMSRNNHLNNEIYIHDLDSYAVGMHNCLTCPIDDLLKNGFTTRQCDIRPAGSVSTASQLLAVVFQIQSLQQFGGVAVSHLDWTMVPYVRKSFYKHFKSIFEFEDKPLIEFPENISIESDIYKEYEKEWIWALKQTAKEVKQSVEGMYHNLNSLQSRSGCQLPFSSINYGTCTLPEGRMVIKALLEGSLEGTGPLHKTSIFPCGCFQLKKGVNRNPGEPNYDLFRLALKSTAKRLYPNYVNCDWSVNKGYDENNPAEYVSTMGK